MAILNEKENINIQIKGGQATIPQQSSGLNSYYTIPPGPPSTAIAAPTPAIVSFYAFGNACLNMTTASYPIQQIAPPPGQTSPIDMPVYLGDCADSLPCPQSSTSYSLPASLGGLIPTVTSTFPITGGSDSYLSLLEQYGPMNTTLNPPGFYPNIATLVDIDFSTGDFTGQGQITFWSGILTGYSISNINYNDSNYGDYSVFATVSDGLQMDDLEYMTTPNVICNGVAMSALTKQEVLMGVVEAPEIQSEVFIERGKQSVFERIQRFGEIDNIGSLLTYGYGFNNIKEEITNG